MIIYSKSPYFVTIAETGQVGSKLEVFIWNNPNSQPATATYTLTKAIPSTTQIATYYNIAPLLLEYIDNVAPTDTTEKMFCNVTVKRYKETSIGVYSLLDTTTYKGVNGYTQYRQGYNHTDPSNYFVLLADDSKEVQYLRGNIPYVNILINTTLGDKLDLIYTDKRGNNSATTTIIGTSTVATIDVLKVDLTTDNYKYDEGNYCYLKYYVGGVLTYEKTFTVTPICESKYTPVVCSFINRFGGWQFLTFFKAQTSSINVNKSAYNLMPDVLDYNINRGQSKIFNTNGSQSITLNTGWVPENYKDLIQDLLLSDVIMLDGVPATVRTNQTDLKTSIKDKNINYQIDFEYAFDLVNTVI